MGQQEKEVQSVATKASDAANTEAAAAGASTHAMTEVNQARIAKAQDQAKAGAQDSAQVGTISKDETKEPLQKVRDAKVVPMGPKSAESSAYGVPSGDLKTGTGMDSLHKGINKVDDGGLKGNLKEFPAGGSCTEVIIIPAYKY